MPSFGTETKATTFELELINAAGDLEYVEVEVQGRVAWDETGADVTDITVGADADTVAGLTPREWDAIATAIGEA